MKLFNYGKNHRFVVSDLVSDGTYSTIDKRYSEMKPVETISFDRCFYTNDDKKKFKIGEFKNDSKTLPVQLNTNDLYITNKQELYNLPNKKTIDLLEIFAGYGGNQFYSIAQDKNENRLIFYFESISNQNACGHCGASEGEKDTELFILIQIGASRKQMNLQSKVV